MNNKKKIVKPLKITKSLEGTKYDDNLKKMNEELLKKIEGKKRK